MTLLVAASAGRAERTVELLKEYEILAVPVERAEDARYAAVPRRRRESVPWIPIARRRPADLFGRRCLRRRTPAPERRRSATKAFLSDLRDLKVGDFASTSITGSACSSA